MGKGTLNNIRLEHALVGQEAGQLGAHGPEVDRGLLSSTLSLVLLLSSAYYHYYYYVISLLVLVHAIVVLLLR